jgi:hypothetical protein
MAKTSTGQGTPVKSRPAAPSTMSRKPAKTAALEPKKKIVAKKATIKKAVPKMAAAPKTAAAAKGPGAKKTKEAGVKTKASTPKKAPPPQKATPPKRATPNKAETPGKGTHPRKAPPKASPPDRATAKTVAVKEAAARRPNTRIAIPTPAARRARTATPRNVLATPRPASAAEASPVIAAKPQVFAVSHLNQNDFKTDGLRTYAKYRDLGIAIATGGLCQAHVIRFTPPCTDEVRKRHAHQAGLQLVYVLQGWMKNEFEGHGEQMMSAGSCWLQPSGIKHTVLDYSADCEVLEIIVPADFKTDELP